jgi:hypothetical protein
LRSLYIIFASKAELAQIARGRSPSAGEQAKEYYNNEEIGSPSMASVPLNANNNTIISGKGAATVAPFPVMNDQVDDTKTKDINGATPISSGTISLAVSPTSPTSPAPTGQSELIPLATRTRGASSNTTPSSAATAVPPNNNNTPPSAPSSMAAIELTSIALPPVSSSSI